MANIAVLERITDRAALERQLKKLVTLDPRLEPVLSSVGEVPLRLSEGGFAGMAQIVTSQLLSVASARAIHGRVVTIFGEVTAARMLTLDVSQLRACGLSKSKIASLKILAEAEIAGVLDYGVFGDMPAERAIVALTKFKGIGPWSAEIYLLFCTGHPDIFPAGDLALQKAIAWALGMPNRPDEKAAREITSLWSPCRGAAARLMWRYFAVEKVREGVSL